MENGKDTSVIPEGSYCYVSTGEMHMKIIEDNGKQIEVPVWNITPCPYFILIPNPEYRKDDPDYAPENIAYCEYVEQSNIVLLDDQCKICGVNDDWDEEEK